MESEGEKVDCSRVSPLRILALTCDEKQKEHVWQMNEIQSCLLDLVRPVIPRDLCLPPPPTPSFSTAISSIHAESAYCVPGGHSDYEDSRWLPGLGVPRTWGSQCYSQDDPR